MMEGRSRNLARFAAACLCGGRLALWSSETSLENVNGSSAMKKTPYSARRKVDSVRIARKLASGCLVWEQICFDIG